MRKSVAPSILILCLGLATLTVMAARPVQGNTGLVCFSASTNNCPSSPPTFSAPIGSLIVVYVVVQGSDAFNGFNIWSGYDPSALNATAVSLAGTVLPDAIEGFECINCRFGFNGGPGTVALAASGGTTSAPTTGLLFSITFNVIGATSGSSMGFFCVTNPSGPIFPDCARVFNGSTLVPENVQYARFITSPGSGMTIPIQATFTFDGLTISLSGSVTIDTNTRTITGTISVVVTNSTTGAIIFSKTFTFALTYGSSGRIPFVLLLPTTPLALGTVCRVDTTNSQFIQVGCSIVRDPDIAHHGIVDLIDVGIVFFDFGAVQGSGRYNPAADLDADGTISIIDAGVAVAAFGAPVFT